MAVKENYGSFFNFLSLSQPGAPKVKKNCRSNLFSLSGRPAILFHSDPYLERGRQFSFTLAGPAWLGFVEGRATMFEDGDYLGRQNPGRPPMLEDEDCLEGQSWPTPMLEDEDYLVRQNPGQDCQAPRSIILRLLRDLKANKK